MTDILVTSPFRPFTLPTQFKAVFNGYIYCGTVDAVDPSVSQVQVYLVNESGDKVPVAQPLRTNAGGFLVYNGQPAKFVTNSNHSLLVRDSLGSQLWYEPNMANVDPQSAIDFVFEKLAEDDGSSLIGYSGVLSVDDRLRITGVTPSDREWNCTSITPDCATQIEEAWLKAQELKTNLVLPLKYKVSRKLDMNCPSYFVGSEIVGNGKWATGIEYTGSTDIDSLLDFRTIPGNTITTTGIRNLGLEGHRKVDALVSSLGGFAFTDLKIDNSLFNGGKVANVDVAAFVATINNNYFRDSPGIGLRIREKPAGWVGGYQNTTLFLHGNYSLYTDVGYSITNVGYSEISANACDGDLTQVGYVLDRVSGAFRNNGAERVRRYGTFTSCVLSELSGYAVAIGTGFPGVIESALYFAGGCDVNVTGFSDLDAIAGAGVTFTDKIRVARGNANLDIRFNSANIMPTHVGLYGAPPGAAKNPRGVQFYYDNRYTSKNAGGQFAGGVISNEFSGVSNTLGNFKNPISKGSLSFYLGSSGQQARLSEFPLASVTKTNAAMFIVNVKGMSKYGNEAWEYIAYVGYANAGAINITYTTVKARTGGQPFNIADVGGFLTLTNTGSGTDSLFVVDVIAAAAGGVSSASMSIGANSQFF